MVAHFLGLKLRLMANTLRRSPWQAVGVLFGTLYGIFVAFLAIVALIVARTVDDVGLVRNVVVDVGSLVVLGFCVVPLIFGTDDTLDPRRFALFGIENRVLARGLLLGALIGIPSIVMAFISLATVATWSRNIGATLLAIVCAAAILATCVLVARVTTSVAAFALATRRAREFSGVIGIVLVVMLSPIAMLLLRVDWPRDGSAVLASIASWLSWTPLGAVWSAPGDAATGAWGVAIVKLLIALATIGLLWLAWIGLVAKMLVTVQRQTQTKAHAGLGWFALLSGGSTAAVAARSLTYWGRDSRYWVSILLIPLVPVLMIVALTIAGVPSHNLILLPLPIMCLFLGWSVHNDVSYDSTAIWLHIASGTRGIVDRVGRIVPVIMIGIPLIAIGSIVTVYVYRNWSVLPSVIGLSTAVLLVGIGLSSFTSAWLPYPATHPGESPFSQPQASGSAAAFVQSLSFVAIILLCSPVVIFALLGLFSDPVWNLRTLLMGIGVGVVLLAAGVWAGAAVFTRRGPEILALAVRND